MNIADSLINDFDNVSGQKKAVKEACKLLVDSGLVLNAEVFQLSLAAAQNIPVTLKDAAALMDCSKQWIRELGKRGELRIYRPSGRTLYVNTKDLMKVRTTKTGKA